MDRVVSNQLKRVPELSVTVEDRTGDQHLTELMLWLPYGMGYGLEQDGEPLDLEPTGDWDYPWRATLAMTQGPTKIEVVRRNQEG